MTIDTTRSIEIVASPWKHLGLVAIGIALTALSAAIAFDVIPGTGRASDLYKLAAYVGVPFFGACTAIAAWRLVTMRGSVVTITPAGIRDIRVAAELIPWTAVMRISTWQYQHQRIMVLAVDPVVERNLKLAPLARLTRRLNPSVGADGLVVAATGLKIDYDTLFATACAYAEQTHRPGGTDAPLADRHVAAAGSAPEI